MGIYVWGTGCGASELIEAGLDAERISAFVDSYPMGESFLGRPVILPEKLDVEDCRLLIIASRHAQAVSERCAELNIPREKILFTKNHLETVDRNAQCTEAEKLLGTKILGRLIPESHIVRAPRALSNTAFSPGELENDYVRLASLELICKRLAPVPGAAAELGVYRGEFARYINRLLPQRELYLFDSFEGFADNAGAGASFQAAHKNTAVDRVLALMPHPEKIHIRQGFFPQSLAGLEETFCFVSLDVDFYQATLDGLRYFWPRLSSGGCIMLHDWGNPDLRQVAEALEHYEAELGERLPAVPLCDIAGSLVISKS